jgi:hypothetical protein
MSSVDCFRNSWRVIHPAEVPIFRPGDGGSFDGTLANAKITCASSLASVLSDLLAIVMLAD